VVFDVPWSVDGGASALYMKERKRGEAKASITNQLCNSSSLRQYVALTLDVRRRRVNCAVYLQMYSRRE
jgi:hypothetical protein